jgi:predicted dehydrogenase
MLLMERGMTVAIELGYAEIPIEQDVFPNTHMMVEGSKGSVEVGKDYWIRVTTESGTHARRYPPPRYPWADSEYLPFHASIVPCNRNLLGGLRGEWTAESVAEDNLKTMELVYAAYDSARTGETISLG